MKIIKRFIFSLLALFLVQNLFCQEVLKSAEEEYYIFLSLTGNTTRNYLNYRTLSDSVWEINNSLEVDGYNDYAEEVIHPWANNTLGTTYSLLNLERSVENKYLNYFLDGIYQGLDLRIYGPEWFSSYNTKAPFGVNDGALWQGRGYNTSMTTGLRLEGYGFELTLKPQLSWSENLEFEIMPSKRGNGFGHYYTNCDAPQRFGDSSFWTYDWGDTEIRWSWNTFTVGFGTQSVWLGPNYLYPLLLSNNAATFPKFDVGLRKTSVTIPWIDYYLGDIEGRFVIGKLSESDYFDNDTSNDKNQLVLWSVSFAPSFVDGLTVGLNKVCISKWDDSRARDYLNPFYAQNRWRKDIFGNNGEDQKASITVDWLFEKVGTEFYAEVGIDDYLSEGLKFFGYARYPFHTMSYSVGMEKSLVISKSKNLYGKFNFEWNNTEPSQDYQMWGPYNFGTHSQILQGYTNRGQWLGSGIGYGGNSQYLSFTLYRPRGFDRLFIARNNPDNSYLWGKCTTTDTTTMAAKYYTAYKANFYTGFETMWYLWKGLSIDAGFAYNLIINPLYNPGYTGTGRVGNTVVEYYREKTYWNNYNFNLTLKYAF